MTNHTRYEMIEKLSVSSLFHGVGKDDLNLLLDNPGVSYQKLSRGTAIFTPRDYARQIGLVVRGVVQVNKGDVVMSTLHAGEVFGAVTLYSRESYYVTDITAKTDAWILFLDGALMDEVISCSPLVAKNYIAYLTQRIYFLNRKIDGFTSQGAKKKLALFLADAVGDGQEKFHLPYSFTQLAERLNVSRASLYRAFDELEKDDILAKEGKDIWLRDRKRLQSFC